MSLRAAPTRCLKTSRLVISIGRGLGYERCNRSIPTLVLTSITGFGQAGPYRDFKAPNIVAFAMGGLMNLCGHPGRAPLMGPCDVAYHLGSVHAAFGTLVALFNRRATGRGDHVDVSLQDVLAADPFLRIMTRYSVTGEVPQRTGHSQSTTVAETYQCRDGYARIFVNQAGSLETFCRVARPAAGAARSEIGKRAEPFPFAPNHRPAGRSAHAQFRSAKIFR